MHYIVVAGILGCGKFAGILTLAKCLQSKFSNLIVHEVHVKLDEWKDWLMKIILENEWNHFTLPIAWKVLPHRGGKRYLIGGYTHFIKYCEKNYHLHLSISKKEMRKKGIQMLAEELVIEKKIKYNYILPRCMCICGAGSSRLDLILPSLVKIPGLATPTGLMLGLYDEDSTKKDILRGYIDEFPNILSSQSCSSQYLTAHMITDLKNAVAFCDILLVIVPEFNDQGGTLLNSVAYAARIGKILAFAAKPNLRVILAPAVLGSQVCLCAASLAQAALPNVLSHNVVAVTSGIGVMVRSMLANYLKIPLNFVNTVTVWGFPDVSRILDPTLKAPAYEILQSDQSLIDNKLICNSGLNTDFFELYFWPFFGRRLEEMKLLLGRMPFLAEVEALLDVIHLWYSNNTTNNQLSLGVYSDGTFGIPPGIFFSQPVILENGIWIPNREHPLPRNPYCSISDLFETATRLTDVFVMKNKLNEWSLGLEYEAATEKTSVEDYITCKKNEIKSHSYPSMNGVVEDNEILIIEEIEMILEKCVEEDLSSVTHPEEKSHEFIN